MYLNRYCLRIARIDKVRFKLFELRDNLAMLRMKGTINSNNTEYKTLMDLLNKSINTLDEFSLVEFLRFLISISQDRALQLRLRAMTESLERHKDGDFCKIVHSFFSTMHDMLNRHTRLLRLVIIPVLLFVLYPVNVWKVVVEKKAKQIDEIDEGFEHMISASC